MISTKDDTSYFGHCSNDQSLHKTAQGMVSGGAGQAFSDVIMLLPDITVLAGDNQEGKHSGSAAVRSCTAVAERVRAFRAIKTLFSSA